MTSLKRSMSSKLKSTFGKTKKLIKSNSSNDTNEFDLVNGVVIIDSNNDISSVRRRQSSQLSLQHYSPKSSISNSSIQSSYLTRDFPSNSNDFDESEDDVIQQDYYALNENSSLKSSDSHNLTSSTIVTNNLQHSKSSTKSNELILLPLNPEDESIPPCTTEELTPLIPITFNEIQQSMIVKSNSNLAVSMLDSPVSPISKRKPLVLSTNSSATTSTIGTSTTTLFSPSNSVRSPSLDTTSGFCNGTEDVMFVTKTTSNTSLLNSPIDSIKNGALSSSSTNCSSMSSNLTASELLMPATNTTHPSGNNANTTIFEKSNQIDHFDKSLDIAENDKLADQMALNILDKINEEQQIDELTRFKQEISASFTTITKKQATTTTGLKFA